MYIPEFWCGFIAGSMAAAVLTIVWAIWYGKEKKEMNLEAVTTGDCLENHKFKGQCAILNDGKLIGFQQEEIPTQTANPSGDK